jgi:hypothetical protein
MSKERIRELLKQLHKELKSTDADDETIALVRELDADVRALIASSAPSQGAVTERMRNLEVQFSVKHPIAERILREIVDALAKMGI